MILLGLSMLFPRGEMGFDLGSLYTVHVPTIMEYTLIVGGSLCPWPKALRSYPTVMQ